MDLLYKYANDNIKIEFVDYPLFHLLLTINANIPDVRCGVLVVEGSFEGSNEYLNYQQHLREYHFIKESSDNMPIIIMKVNPIKESAQIAFILGWSANYEPILYTQCRWKPLNEDTWSEDKEIIKSMNRTITILSLSHISLLRKIEFYGKRNTSHSGVVLYARRNTQNYHIKPIKEQLEIEDYIFNPKYQKDELDDLVEKSIKKELGDDTSIFRETEHLLLTSYDLKELRLYGEQYGYKEFKLNISIEPEISGINDVLELYIKKTNAIVANTMSVSVFMRNYHNEGLQDQQPITHIEKIELNKWFETLDNFIQQKNSLFPIAQYVNL